MERPLVSVIIPAFNAEKFLPEALKSVLEQTWRPLEILVVDDGSTDGTSAVARTFPQVQCMRVEHVGIGPARNVAIQASRGEILAFLDADDLWLPSKLDEQLRVLTADPSIDIVFTHVVQFRDDVPAGVPVGFSTQPMRGAIPSSLVVRRTSFDRVGPFGSTFKVGEFVDWYARATDVGLKTEMLPGVLVKRRRHGGNNGVRERASQSELATIVKQRLDRLREKNDGVR